MTFPNLKNNIEKALQEHNYTIAQLEKKAGLKKNNVYNILKGIIQNPSSNNIQAIADALEISVEDLLSSKSNHIYTDKMLKEDQKLILDISKKIIKLSQEYHVPISINDFCNLLKKTFEYNKSFDLKRIDENHLRWTLEQNYKK